MNVSEDKCKRCAFFVAFNGKGEPICRCCGKVIINYCEFCSTKRKQRENDPVYQYVQNLVLKIEKDVKQDLAQKKEEEKRRIFG